MEKFFRPEIKISLRKDYQWIKIRKKTSGMYKKKGSRHEAQGRKGYSSKAVAGRSEVRLGKLKEV